MISADQHIWGLKRLLYQDLTEEEYFTEAESWPVEEPLPVGASPLPPRTRRPPSPGGEPK